MFYNCKSLVNLDLSNFDIHEFTDISEMFHECPALKNIDSFKFQKRDFE